MLVSVDKNNFAEIREAVIAYEKTLRLVTVTSSLGLVCSIPDKIKKDKLENIVVICLDGKLGIIKVVRVHRGTENLCNVSVSAILRTVLQCKGATRFALAHNHPTGDTTPSSEDIALTHRVKEASSIIGIEMIDHVIVGKTIEYTSIRDIGLF